MALRLTVAPRIQLRIGLKLRQLFEMPDADYAAKLRQLEQNPVFKKLLQFKIIHRERFPCLKAFPAAYPAEFAAEQRANLGDPLAGNERLRRLIEEIGEEKFTGCFLADGTLTDGDRARMCGISAAEAAEIRRAVDHAYVQQECENSESFKPDRVQIRLIGGVEIKEGKAVLSFYQRDIWQGRYQIDPSRRDHIAAVCPGLEAAEAERLLRQLQILGRRTENLYRIFEALIDLQADFLKSGDLAHLKPITQRGLAKRLGIDPGSLHRLIQNRSLRLPSGREILLPSLFPGRPKVLKDRVHDAVTARPNLKDFEIAGQLRAAFGIKISRRSVSRYRAELGLPRLRIRAATAAMPA